MNSSLKCVQNVCAFGKVKTLGRSGVVDLFPLQQLTTSIKQFAFDGAANAQRHEMCLAQDHWLDGVEVLRDEVHQFRILLESCLRQMKHRSTLIGMNTNRLGKLES